MGLTKSILVPVDFSKDSINALEHAIYYANKTNANIRLFHVRKNKQFEKSFTFKDFEVSVGQTVKDFMDTLVKKYKSKIRGKLDYKLREGVIYKEIYNQAKYDDSYMVIMGTHGVSGFEEFTLGSNAFRVVANATCPVLTVRQDYINKRLRKIVLPIDVTNETRRKVPFATEIASAFNAELHICSVRESNEKEIIKKIDGYIKQVCDYLNKRGIKYQTVSLFGNNITDMTIEYALSINAGLIVIMTEQTENLYNLWLGPYAQQMVNHSPIPVISYHSDKTKK